MTKSAFRRIDFGAAATLTLGSDMGDLPETDFGVWKVHP